MSKISNYYENWFINHMLRGQPFNPPSVIFLALYTLAPSDEGGGVEVAGGGYARQQIILSPATNGSSFNNTEIIFPMATENWGNITACGIFDSLTGGNLLMWSRLDNPRTVSGQSIVRANIGDLFLSID